MITTSVMIFLIVAASFSVIRYINHMEEEKSFERLYEEADKLEDDIERYADREKTEML